MFEIDAEINFPSLVRVSTTNAALEDLNTATELSNRSSGRSASEAAPLFGNLGMYKASACRKKPSVALEKPPDSRKKPPGFRKKTSSLRQSCTTNECQKSVLNLGIDFKDVYHKCDAYVVRARV